MEKLSSDFVKNIFKSDDKYNINLNNNVSINFSGAFRSRKEPGKGWNKHKPESETGNVSHCNAANDYCLNIWGYGFVEGAPWQYMFDVIYDVNTL